MHGLAYGLATRARRPRPSEKTAFRVIPGPSPQGLSFWVALPSEGRAQHARKEDLAATGAYAHWAQGPVSNHLPVMKSPSLYMALQ